jgi:hypothetical protein
MEVRSKVGLPFLRTMRGVFFAQPVCQLSWVSDPFPSFWEKRWVLDGPNSS